MPLSQYKIILQIQLLQPSEYVNYPLNFFASTIRFYQMCCMHHNEFATECANTIFFSNHSTA
jgi:hypothetical protein